MQKITLTTSLASFFLAFAACIAGSPTGAPYAVAAPVTPEAIEVPPPTGEQATDRANVVATFERARPGDTIRFGAGTYEVGPIIRVATPDLTFLGHPDGTTLRGGDFDPGAGYDQFPEDYAAEDLGILHLFEGGSTVRGLAFENSWFGLILGWHYDADIPEEEGGFLVENSTFRRSQNGIRSTNSGTNPSVFRGNTFIDAHYGVSTLGSSYVVERNTFTMTAAPRAQGHGTAIRLGAEHNAGRCSDNRITGNVIEGQATGISMMPDGSRLGTGNEVRGNRITLRGDGERSVGIELRRRAERGSDEPPDGGLLGSLIEGNHITCAGTAAIMVERGTDDTRIVSNTFDDLDGPAILLGGNRTRVADHAPGIEIRHVTSAEPRDEPLFPVAPSDTTDLDFEELAWLSAQVGTWADDGGIVGAELLVIRDGRTLLHDVYGWSDREEQRPLERGSIYRVRSMTKPFVGTAVLQLVAEGRLGLDDPVAKHLRSFDNERARGITVRQLLTHTAGLRGYPDGLAMAAGVPEEEVWDFVESMESLRELVDLVGKEGVTRTPDEYFYSDLGSSTLAALVTEVTGMPVERVIEERILAPLGLRDTYTEYTPDASWRTRMNSTYVWEDAEGGFRRYWDPSQPQAMAYFEGSGGLYSTTLDYARFAWAWLHGGALGDVRLLPEALAREALEPHADRSRSAGYGYQWMVSKARTNGMPRLFGHGGSDGTQIWVFPETKTMALYFTQSRNHSMDKEFLALLAQVLPEADFLRASLPDAVASWATAYRHPAELAPRQIVSVVGRYHRDGEDGRTVEIRAEGDRLWWYDLDGTDRMPLVPSSPSVLHGIDARIELDLGDGDGPARGLRMEWANGVVAEFTRIEPDGRVEPDQPRSHFADVDGLRLEYFQFGDSGPAVVFVQDHHDYFRLEEAEDWTDHLARFGDAFRVIAPVRRGWGRSEDPGHGYDIETRAGDLWTGPPLPLSSVDDHARSDGITNNAKKPALACYVGRRTLQPSSIPRPERR